MSPPPTADVAGPELAGPAGTCRISTSCATATGCWRWRNRPNPYCLGPDLSSKGRETFAGARPVGITAHPNLTWSMIDKHGVVTRTATEVKGADRPVMVHDVALTAKYLIQVLSPLFFSMEAVRRGGSPLSWESDQGVRVAIIPRDGGQVRWASTDAFWMWRTANAFDLTGDAFDLTGDGADQVVLDYVQWANPGMGVRNPKPGAGPAGHLVRAVINTDTGRIVRHQLDDAPVEFPRIDDRLIGQEHTTIAVGAKTGALPVPARSTGDHDWILITCPLLLSSGAFDGQP